MEQTSSAPVSGGPEPSSSAPRVESVLDGNTARITVAGELNEAARRPLVRILTDLLLDGSTLHRVELALAEVAFMNSAGMAVLVQLQRMAQPRGIPVVLVAPPTAVVRPLQLSGLWHRFPLEEAEPGH